MIRENTQSGFTLVETLVAITILLLVMIGPMTISSTTAKSTSFASEQVTAFFLAQEGVELVQKMRDDMLLTAAGNPTNILSASFWNNFTDTSGSGVLSDCYTNPGCAVEIANDSAGTVQVANQCSPISNCKLYRDTSASVRSNFTYTSGTGIFDTPYTRVIKLTDLGDQVQIVSRVTWRTGSLRAEQMVEVESFVFNVYGN